VPRIARQSDDDDDESATVLEAILGRQVGQREDTACNEDGVDVSVGVDVDAVLGVGPGRLWVSMVKVSI